MKEELTLLQLYGRLHHLHLEPEQLKHQFASFDKAGQAERFGVGQTLQALQALGFDAKLKRGTRQSIEPAALPALMPTRDGHLMLVGRLERRQRQAGQDATVVVQKSGQAAPQQLSLQEFDQ